MIYKVNDEYFNLNKVSHLSAIELLITTEESVLNENINKKGSTGI